MLPDFGAFSDRAIHPGLHLAIVPATNRTSLGESVRALSEAFEKNGKVAVRRFEVDLLPSDAGECVSAHVRTEAASSAPVEDDLDAAPETLLSLGLGGFYYSLPDLPILITGGEPAFRWSEAARLLQDEMRLIVPGITRALAQALAAEWGRVNGD